MLSTFLQSHVAGVWNIGAPAAPKQVVGETDANIASGFSGFHGPSHKDKYIVDQAPSSQKIWWGDINQSVSAEVFDELYETVATHYGSADKVYVFDGYAGANPASRKKVRFITELAWQHHFVTNMFLRPQTKEEIEGFEPDFTIVNACKVTNKDYKKHGLNSEVFVAFNIEKDVAVIGGTWYGGEMKKGIFSMMNYWLPLDGIMAMHCSANKGKHGDTALFFRLSGTGKTSLSADPHRFLIGDDEHGWGDEGIFNFEGGCYAKTINLCAENESDIYNAIKRDALLENTFVDAESKEPDFYNTSKTAACRTRSTTSRTTSRRRALSDGQAMYHFLSGYAAKVAGTERGVTEPTATFSACFGGAFLPLHPTKYADLLQQKLQKHSTSVYLVNSSFGPKV
ncbi:Phosphoenolpyruvate carboxykinase (ATP) [Phytophthora fragariae]|uniref:phosphoenolpyruvate carboxykinase (ATP) n=2 Tax=Phytophthora fragariae TaxID=53985 RepID=A0A6G0RLU3_9STRA|nr:Phosphoenolpyruvate carboxykinase (ATP) [Phytophthora fragariae]